MTVKDIMTMYTNLVSIGVKPMKAYERVYDAVFDTLSYNPETAKELQTIKKLAKETILGRDY